MGLIINPYRFAVPAWLNSAGPITGDGDNGGNNGYTFRQVIAAAQLSNGGGSQVRVTFEASSASALIISGAYIQHAAAAGDAYDFLTTPVQLLFSGLGTSGTISAGTQLVSDGAAFTLDTSKNLVVSFYLGTASDSMRSRGTQTGWTSYLKNASEAATVDVTGYTPSANAVNGVVRVESFV